MSRMHWPILAARFFATALSGSVTVGQVTPPPTPCGRAAQPGAEAFLSDTDKAYCLLERMQALAHDNAGGPAALPNDWRAALKSRGLPEDLTALSGMPEASRDEAHTKLIDAIERDKLATRYESPYNNHLLRDYARRIKALAQRTDHPLSKDPAIGSLPIKDLNAKRILNDDIDRPLIVVNYRVFDLLWSFGKIFSDATPMEYDAATDRIQLNFRPDMMADRLREMSRIGTLVGNEMCWFVHGGVRLGMPVGYLSPERVQVARWLGDSMEFFVLAHEYAHVMYDHKPATLQALELVSDPIPAEEPKRVEATDAKDGWFSWGQEFEADATALQLLYRSKPRQELGIGLWGPDLFLQIAQFQVDARRAVTSKEAFDRKPSQEDQRLALEILDVFGRTPVGTEPQLTETQVAFMRRMGTSTHPPPWIRRIKLRMTMIGLGYGKDMPNLGESYEKVLDAAWADVQARMHDRTPKVW